MAINLNGANKAQVLAALYNAARPLGMGFLNYQAEPMTEQEAAELIKKNTYGDSCYFDYLKGRVMKVELADDTLEERLYDRDNGDGAAYAAIKHLISSE
jgi:hypothetical protein